ncbi:MAG: sulfatase family protein [Myxococcota bacterium]
MLVRKADSALPAPDWRAWIGGLLWLLLLACGGGDAGPRPPNLVLLIGDDHGFPDFGFMGSPIVQTPRLDRLAEEGVVFPLGYSTSSLCRPALRTLLTGLEPVQYGHTERELRAASEAPVPNSEVIRRIDTLPRLLRERGYATFQAGKYLEGHYAAAGFEEGMVEHRGAAGLRQADRLVRETLDPVLAFVDANANRPFFLWFAPKLPHLPHDPPKRFRDLYADADASAAARLYYASISWFDEAVGRLLDHLDARGLADDTLVVYLADNGWDPRPPESADQLALGGPQGKKSLYELGFRTPIVLRGPGVPAPARHAGALVSIADLFPTLLEAAGARRPQGRMGRSLWPLLAGTATPREELVGWTHVVRNAPGRRITGGFFWRDLRWHYLQPDGLPNELYDLETDPAETTNVVRQHPEVVRRATKAIRAWVRRVPQVAAHLP